MDAKIEGTQLVIKLELQDPRPSGSGKTLVVASSRGNQTTTATRRQADCHRSQCVYQAVDSNDAGRGARQHTGDDDPWPRLTARPAVS